MEGAKAAGDGWQSSEATLWRARIEVAMGHDAAALALLRSGLAQGLAVDQAFVNLIPDFDRLRRQPEFQEMFRPKG